MKIKKISLFFDRFRPFHLNKEVGQISLGFIDIGVKSEIITAEKHELKGFTDIPLVKAKREDFLTREFWQNIDSDAVIFITWFHGEYLPVVMRAKESGKTIILKGDTDGLITFPKLPRPWIMPHLLPTKEKLKNVLRIMREIMIYPRKIKRIRNFLEIYDRVTVETPKARENIIEILDFAKKVFRMKNLKQLTRKIDVIPSPVSEKATNNSISKVKEDIIVSGANWNSEEQKNTREMLRLVDMILEKIKGWDVKIAGEINKNHKKMYFLGNIPHSSVIDILSVAKISFLPSIYESFGLFAAESLCMGCFLAITPIEPAFFFSQKGGVFISEGFKAEDIFEKIKVAIREYDVEKAKEVAEYWRKELSRQSIAKKYIQLITKET